MKSPAPSVARPVFPVPPLVEVTLPVVLTLLPEVVVVTFTLTDKPFWLSTVLLKQKITKGLDAFCTGLAQRPSS